jgi:hypothetical protein
MLLRRIVTWSACLSVFAVIAQACPDHSAKASVTLQSRTPSAAALLAWKPRAWSPTAAPGTAGLRVSIDPVDGTLGMPTSDELSASAGVGDEDMRPVAVTRQANGAVRAQLDERWASHAMATVGPDGKVRWTCVDGKLGAERFLKQATMPATVSVKPAPVWEEK